MASFLRFGVLLGLVPTLLVVGCGGRVGGDDTNDTGTTDTGADTTPDPDPDTDVPPDTDPWPDTGPGGCGWGSCSPGMGCSDGCTTCKCVAENVWDCAYTCVDAEPPPPPPCPYPKPADRTYCPVEGQTCEYKNSCGSIDVAYCALGPEGRVWVTKSDCSSSVCPPKLPPYGMACGGYNKCGYANGCGGVDTATCNGKYWEIAKGPCTTPTCPSYLPPEGAPCSGVLKCGYSNYCGGIDTAYCGGTSSYWKIDRGPCAPPPPPPTCPTTTPPDGSPCASGLNCSWNNGCGGINYGYCSGYGWSIKREGCSSTECPSSKPTSGLACKSPGTSSCRYVVSPGSTCTTQCFCADDYRWACVTPPCAEPVPPSYDAGFP